MNIRLNDELINRCNNQSMYNRGTHIQEMANDTFNDFDIMLERIESRIGPFNKTQLETVNKRKKVFKEFVENSYNEYLNIASNFVSSMVAGPANYNTKKYNKVTERMLAKQVEIDTRINNFFINTEKMLKEQIKAEDYINKYRNGYNEPISSDDPYAKEKLEAKLEYLENRHQKYKKFNVEARKKGEQQLPSYVLTNSNQNIKSVKDRLNLLDKMKKLDTDDYCFENGEVHFDKEDNRVKIFFDGKPNEEIRDKLKGHAFRWSPKNMAWQRKLTPDAVYMTKRMFEQTGMAKNKDEEKKLNV